MDNPIIQHIRKKTDVTNQDYKAVFTGECGRGKSYAALRLAETIQPDFNIERQLVFRADEFLRLMNSDLPKGSVIIWDEASTSLDARDFNTIFNKLLNNVLVTMRYRNYVLLFSVPSTAFIDKRARELLDGCVDMRYIDQKRQQSVAKFYIYKHYHAFGKTYLKAPVSIINGEPRYINQIRFNLPSPELLKRYEVKKKVFGDNLYRDTLNKCQELLGTNNYREEDGWI